MVTGVLPRDSKIIYKRSTKQLFENRLNKKHLLVNALQLVRLIQRVIF